MMKKSFYLYGSLFCIHVVIAMIAFLDFRLDPLHTQFSRDGDGMKNLFTLASYVREPVSGDGILKYNGFQYPFGDYIYYTDNTPLFSVPFKWFCRHIYDLSADTIPIFYTVVILNIIVCGLLLFYILRRVAGDNVVSYLVAIILPWINLQVQRIWMGHDGFSLSSLTLLAVCLMIQWHKYRQDRAKQIAVAAIMCVFSFLAFCAQGYYLAIITLFLSAMLFFYGFHSRREKVGKFSLLMSLLYLIVTVSFTLLVVVTTDKYFSLRMEHPGGYDWMETKVRFSGLFTHYWFQNIYFPFSSDRPVTPETAAYLGNVALFAVFVIGIAMFTSSSFRLQGLEIQHRYFSDPLKASILLGALIMLSVSFGEVYYTDVPYENGYVIINVFNPLFYLHFFTKRVEQFRFLERFVWPFFFCFNIWITYIIASIYNLYGRSLRIVIVIAITFLGGWETYDFVNNLQQSTNYRSSFAADGMKARCPEHIEYRNYQAILPIPYYNVGSEDKAYLIDDDNMWSTSTFILALQSRLPLMSSKMSRTPPLFNRILDSFVAYDSVNPLLAAKLTDKPILVAVCRSLLNDTTRPNVPHEGSLGEIYRRSLQFAVRHHLQAIDSANGVFYYAYYPKAKT